MVDATDGPKALVSGLKWPKTVYCFGAIDDKSRLVCHAEFYPVMTDDFSRVGDAVAFAKLTNRTVRENIIFALVVKTLTLLLGAVGIANMWMAIFADVGVALLAILNSLRILLRK
jgi:hypothetical protein